MSRIRSVNTKPEIKLRQVLFKNGFRYRLHVNSLEGRPDIVFGPYKTVIFVHGCFWHAHKDCRYFVIPKTKQAWWKNKLLGNRNRDEKVVSALQKQGWHVIVIWECDIKNNFEKTVKNILKVLEIKKTKRRLL